MRLIGIFLILAVLVIVPFMIWGENLDQRFSTEGTVEWLRNFGAWGWLAGIGLLISDLFLPIPATIIMAALGYVYGPWIGGAVSALGSFLTGQVAYGLCRSLGQKAAQRIAGEKDLVRGRELFARHGGWLVAWSRWMPVFQEAISCMAGLIRMPYPAFTLALACGCLPLGFAFAAIGHAGVDNPRLAIGLSIAVPPVLWLLFRRWLKQKAE